MPRWNKGSEIVDRLLDDRHIERVPADAHAVAALLETAERHVTSAESTADTDPKGAFAHTDYTYTVTSNCAVPIEIIRPDMEPVVLEAGQSFSYDTTSPGDGFVEIRSVNADAGASLNFGDVLVGECSKCPKP